MDGADNILLTGRNHGTLDFGGGPMTAGVGTAFFVAKLSPAGSHLWSKQYSGTGSAEGKTIAVDAAGNVLAAADFTSNLDIEGVLVCPGAFDSLLGKWAP